MRYSGLGNTFKRVYAEEGASALMAGVTPRVSTGIVCFWLKNSEDFFFFVLMCDLLVGVMITTRWHTFQPIRLACSSNHIPDHAGSMVVIKVGKYLKIQRLEK